MSIGKSGIKNLAFILDDHEMNGPFDEISEKSVSVDKQKSNDCYPLTNGKKFTARGYILIFSLAMTVLASCASYSLIAPFFPRVAESKGLGISQYSLIFAVYEVVSFVLPPFCSKLAIRMTPKIFLITALFIVAFSSTLFGFLVYSKDGSTFFVLCIIVRIFWAIGGASTTVAVYLCGTILFPNHVSTIYAAIEIGAGLGFMSGPFIGGILFEIGGFTLPFMVTSSFCLISIIPIYFLIQNELKPKNENKKVKPTSFLQALSVPGVSINLLISAVVCFCVGFNESTLDHHLREISNFSPSQVGRVFLISGLIYSIFTLIFGHIAKKWSKCYYLVFLGLILVTFSFVVLGPLPFLPMKPSLTNVIISQCNFGIGMGALFVLSFDDCVKESKKYLPDNDTTMATISGLYTSSYALGTSVGPFYAGLLVSKIGYRSSTFPVFLIMVSLIGLVLIYVFRIKKEVKKDNLININ